VAFLLKGFIKVLFVVETSCGTQIENQNTSRSIQIVVRVDLTEGL